MTTWSLRKQCPVRVYTSFAHIALCEMSAWLFGWCYYSVVLSPGWGTAHTWDSRHYCQSHTVRNCFHTTTVGTHTSNRLACSSLVTTVLLMCHLRLSRSPCQLVIHQSVARTLTINMWWVLHFWQRFKQVRKQQQKVFGSGLAPEPQYTSSSGHAALQVLLHLDCGCVYNVEWEQ